MTALFDSALYPIALLCLGLGTATAAAQLALAWVDRASADDGAARLRSLLAAGLAVGTGLWAAQAIAFSADAARFDPLHDGAAQFALLGAAALGGTAALAAMRAGKAAPWQAPAAAAGLGAAAVAVQWFGLLAIDAAPAGPWQAGALAAAGGCALAGCPLAVWLWQRLRSVGRRAGGWGRLAAGAGIGATLVVSAQWLRSAAGLPRPASGPSSGVPAGLALAVLAVVVAAVLLGALARLLRWHAGAQAARLAARRQLGTQSLNDPLTRLPFRTMFEGTLAQAVGQADAARQRLALLFVDLDGFRALNQTFGQRDGDRVLQKAATRLRGIAPPHMAARLAGDEFVLLLPGNPSIEQASAFAAAVLAAVGRAHVAEGRDLTVSCSVGVAMYPEHGAMSTMIEHAQAAMRGAKAAGGAGHALFDARLHLGADRQAALPHDLRAALEKRQFELYYQPQVDARSGAVTAVEALVRWHHPARGMVSPVDFIALAERHGLIGTLGGWVIDEACRQARAWCDAGLRLRVAVNLSMRQLAQPDLPLRIGAALRKHRLDAALLTCEITGACAMDDTGATARVLGQLGALGVHLSIDDVGTGESNPAALGRLRLDELKIDRSVVHGLAPGAPARQAVAAIVRQAKAMRLTVVAEGVESEAQYRLLRELGCDRMQGFLFARPMSANALARWAADGAGPRSMTCRASLFEPALAALPA